MTVTTPSEVIADRDPLSIFLGLLLLAILVGGLIRALVGALRKAISEHNERMDYDREQ
jgi:hypothetical protein